MTLQNARWPNIEWTSPAWPIGVGPKLRPTLCQCYNVSCCRESLTEADRSHANYHCDNTLLETLIHTHQCLQLSFIGQIGKKRPTEQHKHTACKYCCLYAFHQWHSPILFTDSWPHLHNPWTTPPTQKRGSKYRWTSMPRLHLITQNREATARNPNAAQWSPIIYKNCLTIKQKFDTTITENINEHWMTIQYWLSFSVLQTL